MVVNGIVRGMVALVVASGVFAATAGAADEKEVVGTWKLAFDPGNGDHKPTLNVTQGASGLVGKYDDGEGKYEVTDVKFKDGTLSFTTTTKRDDGMASATFKGKVKGDTIEGDAKWESNGMSGSFPFTGKREAEKPKG